MKQLTSIRNFEFYALEDRVLLDGQSLDQAGLPQEAIDLSALVDVSSLATADGHVLEAAHTDQPTLGAAQALADQASDQLHAPVENIVATAPVETPAAQRLEVIFIDAAVDNSDQLIAGLRTEKPDVQWVVVKLDDYRSGIDQITQSLSGLSGVDAIHLVSHGNGSGIQLGDTFLNLDSAKGYAGEIAIWANALDSGADLLIYGCDLASTEDGRTLVDSLAALCDCDAAASDDATGDNSLGGDWNLEYHYGDVQANIFVTAEAQDTWHGLLATYTVTNTNDSGAGSLRQAIIDANANAGADTINTNIAATGVNTITLASALPTITGQVTLIANTESDFAGTPLVVLNGNGSVATGFDLASGSSNSTIRGFVIQNFTTNGISINSSNNWIAGNYIGTTSNGNAAAGNNNGINIFNSADNIIGGTTALDRNVISGNTNIGVNVVGASNTGTVIEGNYIGVGADGSTDLGNRWFGIFSNGATYGTIGGTVSGAGNVISGTGTTGGGANGVYLNSTSSYWNIQGNTVGLNAAGTSIVANDGTGIAIHSSFNTIGGTGSYDRNVVSGNASVGIILSGSSATNNSILGNYIGTSATGLVDLGNGQDGIQLDTGASNNTIGGLTVASRNIISGNDNAGISIDGEATDGNTIQNNYIGLGSDGTTVMGNGYDGIAITNGADNTTIGGIGLGNVILGSGLRGILIDGASTGTTIYGNYVGINSAGTVVAGEQQNGILIQNSAANTTIGGTTAGQANTITASGLSSVNTAGVAVATSAGTGNLIVANSIYGNVGLGIDLGATGITANDTLDPDSGPNNLQNFPVITSVTTNGTNVVVSGTLNTLASVTGLVIHFYATLSTGNYSRREGKRYLGSTTVNSNASGNATFTNVSLSSTVTAGEVITATATTPGANGNTSEFGQGVVATLTSGNSTPSATQATSTSGGGLTLNADGGNDAYFLANNGLTNPLSATTIEVRFAANNTPLETTFLSYNTVAGDEMTLQTNAAGTLELDFGAGNAVFSSAIDYRTLLDGTIHTLSVTWTNAAGNWQVFLDGTLLDSGTGFASGATIAAGGTFVFGQEQDFPGGGFVSNQYFSGTLYDARVFNDVRTAAEIASTYQATLPYNESGMLANWRFDDLSAGKTITEAVSGNNLTLHHASGTGFTTSAPELTLSINENAASGTVVGTVLGIDIDREAKITQLLAADHDLQYNAETGKFYKIVNSALTWTAAQAAALSTTLNGLNGELVTIRSSNENNLVLSLANSSSSDVWLGGSDQVTEGAFHWYTGNSEADQFWQGTSTGYQVSGAFSNFVTGEPNNWSGTEDAVYLRSGSGEWNDGTAGPGTLKYVVQWNADDVLDATNALAYSIISQTVAGAFTINSDSGVITVTDPSLINYETNPIHTVSVRVHDGTAFYDKAFTIALSNVVEEPTNSVPGSQTINENTSLVFSSSNGNAITISDQNGASNALMQVSLTVANGNLTLSQTTGLNFVSGSNGGSSFVFNGTESAINAGLNGLTFTPNTNYNGAVNLQVTTALAANLDGWYTFNGNANDQSAGTTQNATLIGNATTIADPTHGTVLSLDGNGDYAQISGLFGSPANATLAAWVNLNQVNTSGSEVISLGDAFNLILDMPGNGVVGGFYDGTTWVPIASQRNIAGTGWHHVAFSFDDTNHLQTLYIDGEQVAQINNTSSINYFGGNTFIGRHGGGSISTWDFNGMMDDARVYTRALTATEIASLATDQVSDTDNIAITVNAVNAAPVLTPYSPVYNTTEDSSTFSSTIATLLNSSVTDADTGAVSGIAIYDSSGSGGLLEYSTNGGANWSSVGAVSVANSLLLRSTDLIRFSQNGQNGGTLYLDYHAWDQTSGTFDTKVDTSVTGGTTAFSSASDQVTVNVTSINDAPVLDNNGTMTLTTITEDQTSNGGNTVASVISSAGGDRITDVDNSAGEGIAITATSNGNGTWQYSTDSGSSWNAVGTVSNTSALLLRDTDSLRFVPNGLNATTGDVTFRAWDQTSGSAGSKVSTASNGGTTAFSTVTEVASITVTSVNDAPYDITTVGLAIAENSANGSVVGSVAASDFDTADSFTYSLVNDAGGRFAVNSTTGQVTVANGALLDYETSSSHSIIVLATDAGGSTVSKSFTVTISDAPEGPTTLTLTGVTTGAGSSAVYNSSLDSYYALVSPNMTWESAMDNAQASFLGGLSGTLVVIDSAAENTYITSVSSTAWLGASDKLSEGVWRWYNGDTPGAQFWAGGASGSVVGGLYSNWAPTEPNNFIGSEQYGIVNNGSNWNDVSNLSTTNSIVEWTGAAYRAAQDVSSSVLENATAGTAVGTLSATDPDTGETFTYTLVGGATSKFEIVGTLLQVKTGATFDYETTPVEILTVRVTDSTGNTRDQAVTINVVNINETPTAVSDTVIAVEAGGSAGTNPSGFVLANDLDPDSYDTKTVVGVAAGTVGSASGSVGVVVNGTYGAIQIDASGGYTYNVDNSNPTVQAMRLSSDTLTDTFTYTMQDAGGLTSTTQITITIQGANDAPDDLTSGGFAIDENSANGTVIGNVTGSDLDNGDTLTYSLTNNAGGRFAVNSVTGQVTVADGSLLDRETAGSHLITVRVTDTGGLTFDKNFTININDVNEFAITSIIDANAALNSIPENSANGTVVGVTASAFDADATTNAITYSLDDSAGGRFAINSSTGVVTVADGSLLDYETATSHLITVRADSADGSSSTANFTINLTDISEAGVSPVTDADTSPNVVIENSAIGTVVGITGFATDADASDVVTYTLDNDAGGLFAIDTNTGVVTVAGAIDREAAASYNITIRATSTDSSYSTQTYTVNISDLDEFAVGAITDVDGTVNSVAENAAIGTVVGITASANDADATNNTISYSLQASDSGRFAIDSVTGVVTVSGALDREAIGASRNIIIRATSTDGSYTDQNFAINLVDVNEFNVTAPSDTDVATNAVNENAANGTIVGITAFANDADATTNGVTFSLFDDAGGRFAIDTNTGVVTVADGTLLDRETAASHNIIVRATSADGSTNDSIFTINLNDVNESTVGSVADTNATANTVNENAAVGTQVGVTAFAQDADATNNVVTYSLDIDAGGRFTINATTGIVTVAGAIDYEAFPSHNITVRATSQDGSFTTQVFSIAVADLNDNAPVIASSQTFAIAENLPSGTSVGFVSASDVDTVGTIQNWTIVSDSSGGGFSINAVTGEITTNASFNYEQTNAFTLVLHVGDGVNTSANQSVTIQINDVNEAPVAVAENFTIRTDQILNVNAPGLLTNDVDVDGDTLFPVLVTGASHGVLSISADGHFTYDPNSGFFGTDTFQYEVTDGSLTSNIVTVTIHVTAVNVTITPTNPTPTTNTPPPTPIPKSTNTDDENDGNGKPTVPGTRSQRGSNGGQGAGSTAGLGSVDAPAWMQVQAAATKSTSATNEFGETAIDTVEGLLRAIGGRVLGDRRADDMAMGMSPVELLMLQRLLQVDLEQAIVWNQWEKLRDGKDDGSLLGQFAVGTAGVTAGLVSVGYVMWALRGGMFLATVYSSLPAWRMLDPATLLINYRSQKSDTETDSLEKLLGD